MSDFETHPVGYVDNLKHNLKVEEQARDRFYQELIEKDILVAHLKQEIFELKQGACRFNCRTQKEAFIDGFRFGIVRMCREILGSDYPLGGWCKEDQEMAELAYREWNEQEN